MQGCRSSSHRLYTLSEANCGRAKSWCASITDNNGKRICKSFSTNKYPNAKYLAEIWRLEREEEFDYRGE